MKVLLLCIQYGTFVLNLNLEVHQCIGISTDIGIGKTIWPTNINISSEWRHPFCKGMHSFYMIKHTFFLASFSSFCFLNTFLPNGNDFNFA